jgi:hypothetical protein
MRLPDFYALELFGVQFSVVGYHQQNLKLTNLPVNSNQF